MSDIIITTIITGMRNFIEKHIGGTLLSCRLNCAIKMELRVLYKTHERMRICKRNRPFKKQKPLPHKFEWIEMEIAKNREEYGLP